MHMHTIAERESGATNLNMEEVTDLLRSHEQEEILQPMKHLSGEVIILCSLYINSIPDIPW